MTDVASRNRGLLVFRGRAGDRNELAMHGAELLGAELSQRLDLAPVRVGEPEPPLHADWATELAAALPALREMSGAFDGVLRDGLVPVTALTRCAVALATLPVLARHRPDTCVVWFDAHADCNTPETSPTGYLGGLVLAGACGMWDTGLGGELRTENVILGGAREIDPGEQRLIDDEVVRAVPVGRDLAARVREAVAGRPVYFHLDCDVLDPGIAPTEYRVPGGLSLNDLHAVAGVLAEHEVVGLEIAEFQGVWAPGGEPVSPVDLVDALRPLLGC